MELFDWLQKNPIVSMSTAYQLISHITIAQHGLTYPDNLDDARARIRRHLLSIMRSDKSISCFFCTSEFGPDGEKIYYKVVAEELNIYGYCPESSTVNIIQLLDVYNKGLVSNGKSALFKTNEVVSKEAVNTNELSEMILAITDSVCAMVLRDDKLKADSFHTIIEHYTSNISDPSIKSIIPELIVFLRNKLESKKTKGRITSVTDKKIQAAICLADKYKPDHKLETLANLLKDISGYDLCKQDKEHVAKTFLAYRQG